VFDLVIENGAVLDGTGSLPRRADVGIIGERIAALDAGRGAPAFRRIDASGLTVAPGFIDPHSHTDQSVHSNRDAHSTIRQGVTTEVVGNCGMSNAPVSNASIAQVQDNLASFGSDHEVRWRSFGEYLDDIETGGTSQNLAVFVGHSAIRAAAGVHGPAVTDAQMQTMKDYVDEAMRAGALGLSSGLEYDTGRDAGVEELISLAEVAGRHGGFYASHIRNRDARLTPAIDEFLRIAAESRTRAQISHLNVRYDTGVPEHGWEDAVAAMERARASGMDVQADMTPFHEGLGRMIGILPSWFLAPGYAAAAESLADPQVRRRLRADCDRYWRFLRSGQWNRARPLDGPADGRGLTFAEIAERHGQDPWDCYFDILAAAGAGMVNLWMVGDLLAEELLAAQLQHPLFSLGVDAYSAAVDGATARRLTPLSFRGHVEYLASHVREGRRISLVEAVRKMTDLPATRFGLAGRGAIRRGYYADLVVFDPDTVRSDSSWSMPGVYPHGIPYVVVNGELVIDDGAHTGARPGKVLRRG
jgi:N-acyl-D-amino-acid deacylase